MAYNYNYPVSYQPMQMSNNYPQMQPQMNYNQAMSQQQQQGIIWVQGEAAAKAYPVAAGSNVLLMDSEGECFYIKSTDASGMPLPLRVFEYKEIVHTQPQISNTGNYSGNFNPNEYVKKEELEEVKKQIQQMNSNSQHILERKAANNVE